MKITPTIVQNPLLYNSCNPNPDIENEPICGQLIGEGSTAEVFEDANDSTGLYKKYDLVGN